MLTVDEATNAEEWTKTRQSRSSLMTWRRAALGQVV